MAGEKNNAATVRALVRGTRTALYVQLFVAVLALGAIVFALVTLRNIQAQVAEATTQLESARTELTTAQAQRDAIAASNDLVLQGRDALGDGANEAAVIHLREAVALYADDATAQSLLAQALYATSDFSGAVEAMRRAVGLKPERFGNHARLAAYLCAAGDGAAARAAVADAPEGFITALREDAQIAPARDQMLQHCGAQALPPVAAAGPAPSTPGSMSSGDAATPAPAAPAEADPYRVRIIYLHIRAEADRADAERVAERLRAEGFRVPGIELVPAPRGYGANLRYYYEPQAPQADRIASLVSAALNEAQIAGWAGWSPRKVSLAGGYENLPRDRVEVWFPAR
ncbi:MAG: hypothetical protein GC206_00505 [Alphaproteobacteria bacterium]|nr:hypothetical protein [Alphaproteobacteria bacterium]